MKMYISSKRITSCFTAITLIAAWAATTATAAGPALQGQLTLRPLTPQEKKNYSLSTAQGASGMSTIGMGQPAYLDALVNAAVPQADITNVMWTLISKPSASNVELMESPLGANVPPYNKINQAGGEFPAQVIQRKMLRPDAVGQYAVKVLIETANSGSATLTNTITAGTYLGASTCAYCHTATPGIPAIYNDWAGTPHATAFAKAIDGISTDHFGQNCISCHVVGFDANTNALNDGWDDIAKETGWVFPPVQTNGNWAAMPTQLKNVSNIQCENCHGAGSEHAVTALFDPAGSKKAISVTYNAGSCSQCHDSLTHHYRSAEWNNSKHAGSVEETSGSCARCHEPKGYADFAAGKPAVTVSHEAISCAACHDPHVDANPHQLRTLADVKLMDNKTVVKEGGSGKACMQCHISRRDATNYVEITTGSNRYGPHHGPQTDMLVGANAMNYGKEIPSSAHYAVIEDSCVACHMQENEGTPSFTKAGGHTMQMKWDSGTNVFELTEACVQCHGEIEGFDFKRQDYDGDGMVEGVQTEVRGLLDTLAFMLPPVGVAKPNHSATNLAIDKNWTKPQLRAAYNYLFVVEDGSYGVHNLSYAVGLLKTSIADLNGDANSDGLADWWQSTYFSGNINDPMATPNANPSGDGMPNWLKFALGLDPRVAGTKVPDGVVFANGKSLGGEGDTLHIFTAAEVTFNTEVGKKYQIQAVSTMGSGWVNLGEPINGTGAAVSYVTPTRANAQQYYRVVIQ